MTSSRTIEDLRDEMESRVSGLTASPLLAARVAARNAGRQRRRRVAGVAVLAVAATAVAIPIATWPDDQTTIGPSVGGLPVPEGWTAELPGLDLPLGDPITIPYMSARQLVIDGHVVAADPPLDASSFLTVPGGAMVERETVPGQEYPFATSLELFHPDGSVEVIDSGYIAGSTAGVRPDGTVLVVYGWMAAPDADSSEIRILELGSGQDPRAIHFTPPMAVESLTNANSAGLGRVIVRPLDSNDMQALDLETEVLTPAGFDTDSSPIGLTPGGLDVRLDLEHRCVRALSSTSEEVWSLCGRDNYTGSLSPDGATYVTHVASYDAETGERISSFPLPDGLDPESDIQSYASGATGWESNGTVVFPLLTGERSERQGDGDEWYEDAYVSVRCVIASGECQRIPHPVGMLGQFAR